MKNTKPAHAYNGKKVLVTGHTGFKGSWLCIWLKEMGAEIVGYSLEPESDPNNFRACDLEHEITHETGDVRDLERLLTVFKIYQPEFVFHLAAQSLVRRSYADPKLTFDTNVGGTVNALELSAENKRMLLIPEGFTHGFVVLLDTAEFLYKTTDYWTPEFERSIACNDRAISIQWPIQGEPTLSAKDQQAKPLAKAEHFA